jgi:anti-sigma factor RsiW
MTTTERCGELRDALTEVALGVADGTTRGVVMAHLATCENCRHDLASLAAAADELLLLVPEREPSAGFEGRVLARLAPGRDLRSSAGPDHPAAESGRPAAVRRHRARRAVLAAAVVVGLLGVGGTGVWIATEPDRDLAASYRTTLDTADGRYLAAADLTTGTGYGGSARSVGTVFLYEGDPSWAYVVVRGAGAAARYDVTVTVDAGPDAATDAGSDTAGRYPDRAGSGGADPGTDRAAGTREIALGSCVVVADECSAGGVLDVAVHDVVSVRLTTPDGTTWATATPRPTRP